MGESLLRIEKVVFGGKGISRDLSKVTFIPFTLPGEVVRARITKEHSDYQEAEATEIVEPSPERVAPNCPYFGSCGGCQISHASYRKQLEMKLQILMETLERGRVPFPEIEVIASEPFGYRHKARFQFDVARKRIGFYKGDTNSVVDIQECLCLTPGLNRLLNKLRNVLLPNPPSGLKYIECYENEKGETAAYCSSPLPQPYLKSVEPLTRMINLKELHQHVIRFRGHRFPMHPSIFLQVNPGMWKAMVQEVESHHTVNQEETAIELYCGAGFFTASLADRFQRIIACEENESSIRFAKLNLPATNIDWHCHPAERILFPDEATVLIADPPRQGFTKKVMSKIMAHDFHRITYVSCNCSSFARDAKTLSQRYALKRLTLLDLFPQTFHFETVALFLPASMV